MYKKRVLDSLISYAALLVIIFFAGSILQSLFGRAGGALATVLFLAVPFILVRKRKESFKERFGLKLPTIKNFFAAAFIYAGASCWQSSVTYLLYPLIYKNSVNPDYEAFASLYTEMEPFALLVTVAVIPAICEEIFFRGYIQSSYMKNGKKGYGVLAVIISSLLFCLAHFSLYKAPATFIVGLAFGYIAYKTGSVLLPVIFHFLNNANAIIAFFTLENQTPAADVSTILLKDTSYYFIGLLTFALGLLLIFIGTRLFARQKLKFLYKLLTVIICIVIIVGSFFGMLLNELEDEFSFYDDFRMRGTERVVEKSFELDRNALCIITNMAYSNESIEIEITLFDSDGEERRIAANASSTLELEKGKYTLKYHYTAEDDVNQGNVVVSTEVKSFAELLMPKIETEKGE